LASRVTSTARGTPHAGRYDPTDLQDEEIDPLKNTLLVLAGAGLAMLLVFIGSRLPVTNKVALSAAPIEAVPAEDLDRLLAPIALYPDQLLAQILTSASDPAKIKELSKWLKSNSNLKGTQLQDAAVTAGYEPSLVALVLFPQIVDMMAVQQDWTTQLGKAFATDRSAVFGSIQRLRAQAQSAGTLKTTPQQEVQSKTTTSGETVIVIEPANPQVIYVPQYNPQTVYTTQTVVVENPSSTDAAVAGIIGFTAGIAIGAAIDNDYYYGPYGWRGGAYMYNDAWDDYYDARDDARDDWQDHREDLADERGDRAGNAQEQRTERRETTSEQRTERQENRSGTQAQRSTGSTQSAAATTRSSGSYQSRGHSGTSDAAAARERSGTKSDAFSGYSSGTSTRAASSRGQSSRSGSRSGGGRRR
jgi:hypothetical protein